MMVIGVLKYIVRPILNGFFITERWGGTPLTEGFLIVQLIVMGRSQLTVVVIC